MTHLSKRCLAQIKVLEPFFLRLELRRPELGIVPVQELLTELVEEGADLFLVVEPEIALQHIVQYVELVALAVGAAGGVDGVEGVLLEIHRVQQLALLIDGIVRVGGASSPMTFIIWLISLLRLRMARACSTRSLSTTP